MSKPTVSDSLKLLQAAGYVVPEPLVDLVKDQELTKRGVREIWRCNCGEEYESPTSLTFFNHGCGKVARRIWKSSLSSPA